MPTPKRRRFQIRQRQKRRKKRKSASKINAFLMEVSHSFSIVHLNQLARKRELDYLDLRAMLDSYGKGAGNAPNIKAINESAEILGIRDEGMISFAFEQSKRDPELTLFAHDEFTKKGGETIRFLRQFDQKHGTSILDSYMAGFDRAAKYKSRQYWEKFGIKV
jgi:hypothetical protein